MTEGEAHKKVQEEVNRLSLTSGYIGYCTICSQEKKHILFSDLRDMTSE